ncbi:hypothetical protein [Gordonia sp. CPCC 205333]|uniref:hypothetical protein n=1 Tax=Gordonia sp. CPCC 205333 TaxID=3140790 RepID=UPI003AF33AFC
MTASPLTTTIAADRRALARTEALLAGTPGLSGTAEVREVLAKAGGALSSLDGIMKA